MFVNTLKKIDDRALILVLASILVIMSTLPRSEGFANINTAGPAPREVFTAPHKLECVAGAGPYGYYSKSLTPGGFCDLQSKVRASHSYTIEEGPYGVPLA
tara:strand:- start:8201 stop:8503 length:303 start_codon:yes stop_codon:yes gene_type:complete